PVGNDRRQLDDDVLSVRRPRQRQDQSCGSRQFNLPSLHRHPPLQRRYFFGRFAVHSPGSPPRSALPAIVSPSRSPVSETGMSPLEVFETNDILRVLPSIVPLSGCCPIWFATVPDTLSPSCVMTALAVYSPASVLNVMSQLPAMSAGGALVLLAGVVLVVDVVAAGASVPRFALQSPWAIPAKSAVPL